MILSCLINTGNYWLCFITALGWKMTSGIVAKFSLGIETVNDSNRTDLQSMNQFWHIYLQSEHINLVNWRFLGELFSLPEKFENCRFLRAETEMENIPSPMSKNIYKILTLNLGRVEGEIRIIEKHFGIFLKGKEFQVGSIPFF